MKKMTTTVVKEDASVVLCDIEGTTTSIKFVKDVLFPYVRENLESYLERTWETAQTKGDVQALRDQWTADKAAGVEGAVPIPDGHTREVRDACVKSVRWQMDNDRKATALKQLQGHIWKDAYESGAVKGHVYDDVRPAMERWVADGIQVQVYSSGSVAAQKLLFKHSENGDMTKLLSGHYDTRIGGKMEAASYRRIAEEAMTKPNSILFLSDRIEECEAARAAGLMVVVSIRPGNADIPSDRLNAFESITSFDQLVLTPVDGEPTTKTAKTAADDHGSTADAGAKGSSDTA